VNSHQVEATAPAEAPSIDELTPAHAELVARVALLRRLLRLVRHGP
jgi:hypothetical protein